MGADGELAVDGGTGDLFEQWRAFVRCGLQVGGEFALGEEHGAGEAAVVHAGELFDGGGGGFEAAGEELAARGVGDFVFGVLQFAVGAAAGAVLAPVAAVAAVMHGDGGFGEAGAGVAAHDVVRVFVDAGEARGAAIEGEADRVKDGGFACAGRAGDGVEVVVAVGGGGEVDFPGADEGVEVVQADVFDAHRVVLEKGYSALLSASWMSVRICR